MHVVTLKYGTAYVEERVGYARVRSVFLCSTKKLTFWNDVSRDVWATDSARMRVRGSSVYVEVRRLWLVRQILENPG